MASRREFLRSVLVGAGAAAGASAAWNARAAQPGNGKPNVLFIMSDDLCTALSGYGHPQCNTPNLDRIASRGVQFERAYCQYPVCGPSRASIMTGLYPASIGATSNGRSDFRKRHPDIVTLPQLFRQNGYYTARVSKIFHMGVPGDILAGTPGRDDPLAWDEAVNIQGPEQNAPGERVDLCPKVTHQGVDFVKVEAEGGDLVHADGQTAQTAVRLLREHAREPFFLAVGMVRPHVPLVAPQPYFEPYSAEAMQLASVPSGDLDDVPEAAQSQTNAVKYGMSEAQQKETLRAYYAAVAYMDAQVGKVLDELERLGLADNTIIVFTSDHGYSLGEHTCWQKLSLFEEAVRVPFLMAAPGMAAGVRCGRVVELMDIYPAICELCGLRPPGYLHGESFAALLRDPAAEAFADAQAYTISRYGGESLCTERWRYNLWKDGEAGAELYDHKNDPGEFTNLADDPAHAETVAHMAGRLRAARAKASAIAATSRGVK